MVCLICPNIAVTSPHPSSFAFRSLLIPGATIEEAGESLIKIREAISSGLNFANADIARGDTELLELTCQPGFVHRNGYWLPIVGSSVMEDLSVVG